MFKLAEGDGDGACVKLPQPNKHQMAAAVNRRTAVLASLDTSYLYETKHTESVTLDFAFSTQFSPASASPAPLLW